MSSTTKKFLPDQGFYDYYHGSDDNIAKICVERQYQNPGFVPDLERAGLAPHPEVGFDPFESIVRFCNGRGHYDHYVFSRVEGSESSWELFVDAVKMITAGDMWTTLLALFVVIISISFFKTGIYLITFAKNRTPRDRSQLFMASMFIVLCLNSFAVSLVDSVCVTKNAILSTPVLKYASYPVYIFSFYGVVDGVILKETNTARGIGLKDCPQPGVRRLGNTHRRDG